MSRTCVNFTGAGVVVAVVVTETGSGEDDFPQVWLGQRAVVEFVDVGPAGQGDYIRGADDLMPPETALAICEAGILPEDGPVLGET